MPIARSWKVTNQCHISVWHITENHQELLPKIIATADEWQEYQEISHPQKQLEWLSGRYAMRVMVENLGYRYEGMLKDIFGKPHLINHVAEISITHTKHYIGIVVHFDKLVGIDMEQVHEKLLRTAPKFLSDLEKPHAQKNLKRICTYWCAKEAIYKMHGTRQLSFKDHIFIEPFLATTKLWRGKIEFSSLPISYQTLYRFWIEDFCGVIAISE